MATNTVDKGANEVRVDDVITCNACGESIASASSVRKIACGHIFHKACLDRAIKTRPFCPICDTRIVTESGTSSAAPVKTRSQAKQANNPVSLATGPAQNVGSADMTGNAANVAQTQGITQLVTDLVSAQQAQFMADFSAQMSQIIERQIASSFAALGVSNSPDGPSRQRQTSPQQMQTLPVVENRTFRELFGITPHIDQPGGSQNRHPPSNAQAVLNTSSYGSSSSSDLTSRPDKVLQIISNWKLKFNGGQNGISVDNFIYRVEALTAQTLQGNYDLLCGNASSLFDGKVNDWFWRYHRSVNCIRWQDLCRALREQYQDSRTDVDLRELIRERKQKPNESFDSFYDSIVSLTDRLRTPLSDGLLVEILRRNLLPEIQHEILNIEIRSLQHLRDTCRRREFFMQDMRRRHGLAISKPVPIPKRLSELDADENVVLTDPPDEISAINFVCWNCGQGGHRYQDCLEERTIFCYGCGAPNTYRPNCAKCASKNGRFCAQTSAHTSSRAQTAEIE